MPQSKKNTTCYQYSLLLTALYMCVSLLYITEEGKNAVQNIRLLSTLKKNECSFELLQKDSFFFLSKPQFSCTSLLFPGVNRTQGNLLSWCLYNTQHHRFPSVLLEHDYSSWMFTLEEQKRKKEREKKCWNEDVLSNSLLSSPNSQWVKEVKCSCTFYVGKKNKISDKTSKTTFKLHISYTLTMQAHFSLRDPCN